MKNEFNVALNWSEDDFNDCTADSELLLLENLIKDDY